MKRRTFLSSAAAFAVVAALPRSADYMTISGLVLAQLGRLPDIGDTLEVAGIRITVLAMEKRRITRLRVERLPEA